MSIVKPISPTAPQDVDLASARYRMMVACRFTVGGFAGRWAHCHLLANYLARYVAANEGDPERQATLLSTFINELLEVIYRNHASHGQIELIFRKMARSVLLQVTVPVDESHRIFYRMAVQIMSQPDLKSWFRARLEEPAEGEDAMLGLLELAAVYACTLTISEPPGSNRINLLLELPEVEDMGEV